MPWYAHIKDGGVIRRKFLTDAEVAKIPAHKQGYIVPIMQDGGAPAVSSNGGPQPPYDSTTHHAPVKSEAISASELAITWAAPLAKTAQEIVDEADAAKEKTLNAFDKLSLKVDRNHENRLRMLEGDVQPQLGPAQFRALLKSML